MSKVNKRKLRFMLCILIMTLLVLPSTFTEADESKNTIKSCVSYENYLKFPKNITKNKDFSNTYGVLAVNSSQYKKDDLEIYPGGTPVGIKISTEGVLAVGYSDIESNGTSKESPAKEAGIEIGDVILEINGEKINSSKDLSRKINQANNDEINVLINREGESLTKTIKLIKNNEENYKIGLWVRDSTAGVGTLTFYHKSSEKYGALGHPIADGETEKILDVREGNLFDSTIINVRKGERGLPGELKGIFLNENLPIGSVNTNTQCGIFGSMSNYKVKSDFNKAYKVAYQDEVKLGKAHIISTIDENGPQMYEIEIVKLSHQVEPTPKSMVIKVTDQKLLEKTGGIVQGMSGSPIIQDNKIIGAVTHVLVNKPDTGYGIYIEWMLKDAKVIK